MSYLTSRAPSTGPSTFDILPSRFTPLTPPETDAESAQAAPHEPGQEVDSSESQQATVANGTPSTHFRRPSGLLYTNNGLSRREPRITSKQSRWLVMVMPPASLNHEPPALGHTLSLAPTGRFSNGILMPLFPTLYGQLTAIAKEFNMPSTTGLCVYLQLSESGVPMFTPRISDESWQLLWGHVFAGDERAVRIPPHGLPILGRIEFDIDLRRAKWFDSWMGYTRRDRGESEYVSRESSVVPTHWRTGSRSSALLEGGNDESPPLEDDKPTTNLLPTTQRQVPRPLLLERRDAAASIQKRGTHAPGSHRGQSPPEGPAALQIEDKTATMPAPPFAQENEPLTARKIDLQTKVQQWRQSSSVTSTIANAATAAGQPTLNPANMPSGIDVEIDLNEYSWSISSAGPPSQSPESATWPLPLPSVDIPRRLQGSVCLTPSTATSFGPLDDDFTSSPISNASRRPSLDLGARMLEYVPLTPTTATSWGPPDSPLSLPPSPQFIRTPDAAERAFPEVKSRVRATRAPNSQPWRYVWPYLGRSSQDPVSPASIRGHANDFSQDLRDVSSLSEPDSILDRTVANMSILVNLPRNIVYPALEIYPIAYPYNLNEIYPSPNKVDMAQVHNVQRPRHELENQKQLVTFSRDNVYPFLEIYPTVYPHNLGQIYPVRLAAKEPAAQAYQGFVKSVDVTPFESESWFDFASTSFDHPGVTSDKSFSVAVPGPRAYPRVVPYEAVYPYNLEEIYPEIAPHIVASTPMFSHGHKTEGGTSFSQSLMETEVSRISETHGPVKTKSELRAPGFATLNYPQLSVYPSVYPWNLKELYAVTQSVVADFVAPQIASANYSIPSYPVLILYPPYNGFAEAEAGPSIPVESPETTVTVRLKLLYPNIELYAPVYPHIVIYPQTQFNGVEQSISTKPISPRKRAPTPGPGRRRSHSQSPTLLSREEQGNTRRPSRSLVKKELAPPLPGVTIEETPRPQNPEMIHLELHNSRGDDSRPLVSRRRKTHDELHRLVFANFSPKHLEEVDGHAGDLSERSIVVSPDSLQPKSGPDNREIRRSLVSTPVKRRSRSGTMSSQSSGDSYRNAQRSRNTVSLYSSPPIQPRSRSGTVANRPSERLGPRLSTNIGGTRLNSLNEDAISPESPSTLNSSRFSHSPSNTRLPLASSTMSSAFSGSSFLGSESGLPGRKYSLDSSMQLPPPSHEGNASNGKRPKSLLNARGHVH